MFSRTDVATLTAEQRKALGRYRTRWSAIRRSTEPADRNAAEEGVRVAYRAAGFAPPARVVWCGSPLELSRRTERISRADGPNVRWALIDRVRGKVSAQIRKRLPRRLLAEVEGAVNPADALTASVTASVVQAAEREPLPLLTRARRGEPLSLSCVWLALSGREGFRHATAGPDDLSWLSTFEYLRGVLALKAETEPLLGLWQLAGNAGWMQPHAQTCWLCERPELLCVDVNDRLHHPTGPALRFRDGFSVFAWRGVELPRALIEHPDRITLAAIDGETNVQIRRCMIEIMTPRRYVAEGGAKRIAEDETGILWRRTWLAHDAWAAVEVINATPEPDGSRKHYFLQVPPNLQTAREAVAWTYGMPPEVYDQLVMRT
ncbi:MAG: hypothetical protein JO141_26315 [Bradyrhizobium sp.]|nr:hypothetical protein [Bradyrhizobium sp.]